MHRIHLVFYNSDERLGKIQNVSYLQKFWFYYTFYSQRVIFRKSRTINLKNGYGHHRLWCLLLMFKTFISRLNSDQNRSCWNATSGQKMSKQELNFNQLPIWADSNLFVASVVGKSSVKIIRIGKLVENLLKGANFVKLMRRIRISFSNLSFIRFRLFVCLLPQS